MRNEWSTIDSIKGVSPDWEILPLQEFSSPEKNSFVNGPFGSDLLSSELVLAGQPVIYIRDIRNGRYLRKSEVFVTNEKYQTLTACQVNYGDVIIAKVGDPPCESAVYDAHESGIVTQDVIRIRTEELRCSQFIAFILNSDIGKRQVKRIKISGTRDRVSLTDFKKIKFPHPPVSEQRKIAKILSTWDKAITTIEQLLANSQKQKKSLMQQLLTGKKRLLDKNGVRFSGEWESKQLSKLGEVIGGLTYSPSDVTDGSGTLVLRSSNVQNGRLSFDDNVYVTCTAPEKSVTRENDILLCVRNGSRALIGKSALLKDQAVGCFHGAFMSIFRAKEPLFIFQLLQSSLFYREVRKNLGATINSINGSDLKKFTFNVPTDKAEREKIAAVLSTADQEISALQQKLDHLKKEKKALMQKLLTGKRRVQIN